MRNSAIVLPGILAAAILASSSVVLAQHAPPPPGWPLCPRCQGPQDRAEARAKFKVEGHPFDPHDLSGVWGNNGMELDVKNVPAFTAWGYEQYQATRSEESPLGIPLSNSKDPMMRCDPLGYPRLFAYNYGFEFLQLPDRAIQFFEWGHNWRTIWTDGRKLPENPPEPRCLGYAVGHWEETRSLWSRTATTTGRGSLKTAGTADGVSLIVISCGSKRNTGESAMTPWKPR